MSSATTQLTAPDQSSLAPPIYWRFVWKEYRQLRGFWLAILVLTVIVQLILVVLSPATLPAAWLFAAALSAAALFVVAAAATTFAVEQDEGTYGYLSSLPTTWSPIFWGKLTPAVVGGLAMAAAGTLSGLIIGGWRLPAALETSQVLAILGPTLLEALAWGTLFSLTLRRPLLAAILTIAAASAGAALIGAIIAPGAPIFYAETYLSVIAARLALAAVLLLLDTRLAKGWLTPRGALRGLLEWRSRRKPSADASAVPDPLQRHAMADGGRQSLRAELVRLIWQTWRESRAAMLVLMAVGSLLVFLWFKEMTAPSRAVTALQWFGIAIVLAPLVSLLLMAPLAGACLFLADQHRRQYRFLAEHAACPRRVWLARHTVWITVGCAVALLGVALILVFRLQPTLSLVLEEAFGSSPLPHQSLREYLRRFVTNEYGFWERRRDSTLWIVYLSSWRSTAFLASVIIVMAYAAGQFASMALRSGILAGVLAVVLASVLMVWTSILIVWNLSLVWFGLPIAAGMFLATWLRAPDWIWHRNSVRAWLKPLAAVVVPTAVVVAMVPAARLAQLQASAEVEKHWQETLDKANADWHASDTPAARATARLYREASVQLADAEAAIKEDAEEVVTSRRGTSSDRQADERPLNRNARSSDDSNPQEASNIAPQYDEATKRKLAELYRKSAARTIEISRRSKGQFPLWAYYTLHHPSGPLGEVEHLRVALQRAANDYLSQGKLHDCLECNLATLRMLNHSLNGQGIREWGNVDWREREVMRRITKWAFHAGQTSAELKHAIVELDRISAIAPHPRTAVVASSTFVRQLIEEKRLPETVAEMQTKIAGYLPYLANRLPWERKRALRVLDAMTAHDTEGVCHLAGELAAGRNACLLLQHQELIVPLTRETAEFCSPPLSWMATSDYLCSGYTRLCSIGGFRSAMVRRATWQRGIKLQLALIAYQLDHAAYPRELALLVPDYVDRLPLDPHSGDLFWYRPEGFDIELALSGSWCDAWLDDLWRVDYSTARLPAHTPVLWSVGWRSKLQSVRRPIGIDRQSPQPEATSGQRAKEAADLEQRREETVSFNGSAFIFRLPKPGGSE